MRTSHLADIVAIIHVAFVVFVLRGFALILAFDITRMKWPGRRAFRNLHLLAVGYTLMRVSLAASCPLTILEDSLRQCDPSSVSAAACAHPLFFKEADHRQFQISVSIFAILVFVNAMTTSATVRATALHCVELGSARDQTSI